MNLTYFGSNKSVISVTSRLPSSNVRMAEWSKAPDSRFIPCSLIGSRLENSGPLMRAGVRIPFLTNIFPAKHELKLLPSLHGIMLLTDYIQLGIPGDIAQW